MSRSMKWWWVAALSLGAVQLGCNGESAVDPEPDIDKDTRAVATHFEAISSLIVAGTVASEIDPAPTLRVTDQYRNPVQGTEVLFYTDTESGLILNASTRTDANGMATVGSWRLGTIAGRQTLTAALASSVLRAVFTANATAGPASTISMLDSRQTAPVAGLISLRLRVADVYDNPVVGVPVTFEIESGGGSLATSTPSTNAEGVARADWRMGAVGENAATASVVGLERVRFTSMAFETLSYYELDRVGEYPTPYTGWIALGADNQFAAYINGVSGSGEYTLFGGNIVFSYSNDFLGVLGETTEWWAYPYSIKQEVASIIADVIIVNRCVGEDCYQADWTYRRKGG